MTSFVAQARGLTSPSALSGFAINEAFGKGAQSVYVRCLPALLEALDAGVDAHQLHEALPHRSGGDVDLVGFLNCMANLGYAGHSLKVAPERLDRRLLPCLFVENGTFGEDRIFVLRTSDQADGLVIFDGDNERPASAKELSSKGTAYLFRELSAKQSAEDKELRRATHTGWFAAVLRRFKPILLQGLFASGMINVLGLAIPLFIMLVYDRSVAMGSMPVLRNLVIGVVLAIVTEWSLRYLRARCMAWFAGRLDYVVGNGIFSQLLRLPAALIEQAPVSAQVARLKSFEALRDFFVSPLFFSIAEMPFTLIAIAALVVIAGPLAFVPLVAIICYALIMALAYRPLIGTIHRSAKARAKMQRAEVETFERLHAIRANGMNEVVAERFRDASAEAGLAIFRARVMSNMIESATMFISAVSAVAAIVVGVEIVLAGNMQAGALIAGTMLVWRSLSPFSLICGSLPRFEQLRRNIGQINRLMDMETEDEGGASALRTELSGRIEFNRVGLRYTRDNDPVFSGLSFDVKQGELLAITGNNGTGKSTILKLIMGLYRPQAGNVRIDGIDIRQIHPSTLRNQIAYIPQHTDIFTDSLAENIRLAAPLADDDQIDEALALSGAQAEINGWPDGIHTELGFGSSDKISTHLGSQLGLARAYLRDAPILLIDELPYTLLNSDDGESFKKLLLKWKGKRTIIMATNRDDYIRIADKAVLLRTDGSALVGDPERIINAVHEDDYSER